MAGDVHEQVFNEKQFFTEDVVGEDEHEGQQVSAIRLPGVVPSSGSGASTGRPLAKPAAELVAERTVAPTKSGTGGAARERRRKRAAERATKIVYWLETKYDVLPEVCSGFENWKEAPSASYDFDLLWCDTAIPADRFMKLKQYQKMNHFVGMSSITRKNNLGRNLLRMRKQFAKEYRFFPDTWILPTDLSDLKQQFSNSKNKTFIVKPDNGCQGKGIFLVRDVEKVPVDFSTTYVAQRYIHKPFLLDGFKFDLRLYVLVVGCDPLRIFLHRRGLVRLASEQYVEPTGKNLQQSMVHLTNYAINKMNPNFEENTNPDDAQDGHKRSWEAVQAHLRTLGHDVETLMEEIEDLIIKTLIAVQPSLSHFYHSCQPDDLENAMCFEILGFDVMLDHKLQPWLLEVNHAPSFATESDLDRVVKTEVLQDTMVLLNFSPEARRQKKREAREKMEQRAMGVSKKASMEERMVQEQDIARERTAWEDAHLGSYKRLYPSEEKEKAYMHIHDAAINIWEVLMGGTSRRSVRLTQQPSDEATDGDGKGDKGRKGSKGGVDGAAGKEGGPPKRTPEQVREVVERLMAGCSARPRASEEARRRRGTKGDQPGSAGSAAATGGEDGGEAMGEDASTAAIVASGSSASGSSTAGVKPPRPEVQVGEVIKVQTNLGWESVTVRAKRTNGKIDIQFKDGEYMRSVLPRILREPPKEGGTAAGAAGSSGGSNGGGSANNGGVAATSASVQDELAEDVTVGISGSGDKPAAAPPQPHKSGTWSSRVGSGGGGGAAALPSATLVNTTPPTATSSVGAGGFASSSSSIRTAVGSSVMPLVGGGGAAAVASTSAETPGVAAVSGPTSATGTSGAVFAAGTAGAVGSASPHLHPVHEALSSLDTQLASHLRSRRGRNQSHLDVPMSIVPPPTAVTSSSSAGAASAASSAVARATAMRGSGAAAAAAAAQEPLRIHEVRLRQQLQQLISVRPIVTPYWRGG